jgi:hypothetical protein
MRSPGQGSLALAGLVVALALAAWLRFTGVGVGWFMVDQVRDAVTATALAQGRSFPSAGPQSAMSTISVSGPLYYYLIGIPYAISRDPIVAFGFSALLSVVAVYLAFRLGVELFNTTVGVTAAVLYATFPMTVVSGLTLWNPGVMPAFSLGFMLSLWRYVSRRDAWRLAPTVFLLFVLLNLHLSSLIFVPLMIVAVLVHRPPLRWRPLLVGVVGALMLYAPYLLHQAQQGLAGFQGVRDWMGRVGPGWSSQVALRVLTAPFLLPAEIARPFLPPTDVRWLERFNVLQVFELVLCVAGFATCLVRAVAGPRHAAYTIIGLWFALTLLLVPLNPPGVLWYYADVAYPVQFLLIGVLVDQLLSADPILRYRSLRLVTTAGVGAALMVLVVSQVWYLHDFVDRARTSGELRTTNDVQLDRPAGPAMHLSTMTLESKRALAAALASRLGATLNDLERRAHGAGYVQLREDRGYLISTLGSESHSPSSGSSTHFILAGKDYPLRPQLASTLDVGPYGIWMYQPMVQYESWTVATQGRTSCESAAAGSGSDWRSVQIPARVAPRMAVYDLIPFASWPHQRLTLRGVVEVREHERLGLIVSIREGGLHRVTALAVNGVAVAAQSTVTRTTAETGINETLFDVSSAVHPGRNDVCFEVEGNDRSFDLDVYEIR